MATDGWVIRSTKVVCTEGSGGRRTETMFEKWVYRMGSENLNLECMVAKGLRRPGTWFPTVAILTQLTECVSAPLDSGFPDFLQDELVVPFN